MGRIRDSEIVDLIVDHFDSLPYTRKTGHALGLTVFILLPEAAAAALWIGADVGPDAAVTAGLLAGVGVLGGFLFQVLAWVSGRLGVLADSIVDRPPTDYEMGLVGRLDIARANIAYASLVSVVFVTHLAVVAMLDDAPDITAFVSAFMLFHLVATLVLMLLRINRLGKTDRVAALTAHARQQRKPAAAQVAS